MTARIPVRLRLALAFAGAMAVLLVVLGVVLRVSLAHQLDESIDTSLRARADDVAALAAPGSAALDSGRLTEETEDGFGQVLDRDGQVVGASSPLLTEPLLTGARLEEASAGTIVIEIGPVADVDAPSRVLARPAGGEEGLVVAVGTSLEPRTEAVSELTGLLLVLGPIALVLAAAGGYVLAAAALRPVEAMRARAREISGGEPGARLPVPRARDELRRLAETLNEMLERVDGAMERERAFVADASHELRTPLAILKAEVELALADGDVADAVALRRALVSAGEETDRLARLADDLLVIARAERGGLPVRAEEVDVAVLLARCRDRMPAGGDRAIDLEVEPGLLVRADPVRLEQAVVNLLDNALRHGRGRVALSAAGTDAEVRIGVRDEGPGIPAELGPRAFERFARGDAPRGPGAGAGLGLPIVRAIAAAHGGTARIVPGAPAELEIVLPRGAVAPDPAGARG